MEKLGKSNVIYQGKVYKPCPELISNCYHSNGKGDCAFRCIKYGYECINARQERHRITLCETSITGLVKAGIITTLKSNIRLK